MLPAVRRAGTWHGGLLAAAGVIAIGAAVITFNENVPFPGFLAIVPTLGAAAIIAGVCLAPNTRTARLLASPPLVGIGLISYSWYLWHWPLLAIARVHGLGVEDPARDATIAAASLGLAWLTYIFIEEPVRSRRLAFSWSNHKVLGAGVAASLLVVGFSQSLYAYSNHLVKTEAFNRIAQVRNDEGWSRERCGHPKRFRHLVPRSKCIGLTDPERRLLMVWGDSHADHAVGMLEMANSNPRFAVLPRWKSGCPPLLGISPAAASRPDEDCAAFNDAVLAEIDELRRAGRLAGVVLGARWSMYLDQPSLMGEAGKALWQDGQLVRGEVAASALVDGLRSTLQALATRGVRVLIIAPVPEQRFEIPACLARRSLEECSVSHELAERRRDPALLALRSAVEGFGQAELWDPGPALCDERHCLAERDGIVIYMDDEHLSYTGSRWLGGYLQHDPAWKSLFTQSE